MPDQRLRELAALHGVATEYEGWGHTHHVVADATLRSVLAALDVPAATDTEVEAAIREAELAPWRRMLPPVVVTREGSDVRFPVHVPDGAEVSVEIVTETGARTAAERVDAGSEIRVIDEILVRRTMFEVPRSIETGWHTVHASTPGSESAECGVVVTPQRLSTADALSDRQRWGLLAQLYSVRSRRSWGVGDFADLADLACIAGADLGADYLLINPVHAAQPRPPVEPSPYLPATRRFVNPLYIRVENIPETAYLSNARRAKLRLAARSFRKANRATHLLDRDATLRAKMAHLETIFAVRRSPSRQRAFENYCALEGPGLRDFATWCAFAERMKPDDPRWRSKAADIDGAWVGKRQRKLARRIAFHMWLQWICDEQLAAAQAAAKGAGMDIGIVHDLAVGVAPDGADAWTLGSVLATDVSVGAPPDDFNPKGQQWNQPPWRPDRLAQRGYVPYRDMLRTVLRHAGGLRVDHILGLFRLWWIPSAAASAAEGTYVTYDHEALIGILALEAERAGAVVIGEDLGVFEPVVQRELGERGILGTSILWFERDENGPIAPEQYRALCLTSVTTHDLPPTAGYLTGEHIALRSALGFLDEDLDTALAAAAGETEEFLALARERGELSANASVTETIAALYRLAGRAPSMLIGAALVDLVGDTQIQNQPGTDESQYPNWRIPLRDGKDRAVLVEDLAHADPARVGRPKGADSAAVDSTAASVAEWIEENGRSGR